MILEYIHLDGSREKINLVLNTKISDRWITIDYKNKLDFIKKFLPAFVSGQKIVLFDSNHKQLLKFYQNNNINNFKNIDNTKSQLLFFTSGSSGFPLGAFKTKENLEKEVLVLKELIKQYNIKRIIVSVPFIHIYGVLAGLLLPLYTNNITLIVKDDFLPYELLEESLQKNTLIVTTPIFIKALIKINDKKNLNSNLFISSTSPLEIDDISQFEHKFQTNLLQLFGSTETGGIAYKFSKSMYWTPLKKVAISQCNNKLCVSSPFVSKFILDKKILKLENKFSTEDIIELNKHGFKLIGRGNKIIKIAGKRISTIQIESILENIEDIEKTIVEVIYDKRLLKSEQLVIILQAKQEIKKQEIKNKIAENFGVLSIPFSLKYVDKIEYSSTGKKILF